jgi:transposase
MRKVVCTDPRKLGYCFAHWTAPRLAAYLQEQTGVTLCDDWVRRLLKRQGFVWRKTKLTIRNLQNAREKKGGAGATLEAAEAGDSPKGDLRVVVRGRSSI